MPGREPCEAAERPGDACSPDLIVSASPDMLDLFGAKDREALVGMKLSGILGTSVGDLPKAASVQPLWRVAGQSNAREGSLTQLEQQQWLYACKVLISLRAIGYLLKSAAPH